jgi:Tfp pilus assembly protein PilW
VRTGSHKRDAGFTFVELLVGMSLALMIMTAVLTTYVSLGRNFTRSLGLSSANQPNLESQARRTLAYFSRDARLATGISGTPSVSSVTFIVPSGAGTTTIAYTFDSTADTITRTPASGTALVLHSNVQNCYFRYYDGLSNPYDNGSSPYTTVTTYASGIKQVSVTFTAQAGSSTNGTLTQLYQNDSPRLLIRNKSLLQ